MQALNIQNTVDLTAQRAEENIFNRIKQNASGKEQLKEVAKEFESIFVTKLLNTMENTVDKEGSLFSEGQYMKNFKSIIFNEIGRTVSANPTTSIGFATKIYEQMEKYVKE